MGVDVGLRTWVIVVENAGGRCGGGGVGPVAKAWPL